MWGQGKVTRKISYCSRHLLMQFWSHSILIDHVRKLLVDFQLSSCINFRQILSIKKLVILAWM